MRTGPGGRAVLDARTTTAQRNGVSSHPQRPHPSGRGRPASPGRERTGTVAIWLIVLASIVLLPDAFMRWFLAKDALAAVAVAAASVAVARGRLPRWFVLTAMAAAALAVVGVLMSAAPAVQLWGRWPRYEGLVTLPVYFGAIWAGARLLGPSAPVAKLRTLTRAAATAAIALGVVSVLEAIGAGPFPSDLARPGSLTGNATDQGVLGALLLAMLALPVLRVWGGTHSRSGAAVRDGAGSAERLWLSAGLLMAAASVVLSASRAGLLAAGISTLVLLVLEVRRRGAARMRRTLLVGFCALLVLAAAALAVPLTRSRLLGSSPLSESSLEARFVFWQNGLALLGSHPLGVGASGFLNANAGATTGDSTLDSPHNWLLQVALAGGLPLLALVLGIVCVAAVGGLRRWQRSAHEATDTAGTDLLAAALAGLAGYGVALLTHFTAPSTTIVAAVLVGVLVAHLPGGRPAGPVGRTAGSIRSVLLAGWAIWLVVLMSAEVPLAAGVGSAAHGDLAAAEASFQSARVLRPWDADLSSIAAQSFAAAADAQVPDAGQRAVEWAERSRALLPATVDTERALAVGQLNTGDTAAAVDTLAALAALAPLDATVAVQHAIALYLADDISGSAVEVRRALSLDPAEPTALRLQAILISG